MAIAGAVAVALLPVPVVEVARVPSPTYWKVAMVLSVREIEMREESGSLSASFSSHLFYTNR